MADPGTGNAALGKEIVPHDLEVPARRLAEITVRRTLAEHTGITTAQGRLEGQEGYRKPVLLKVAARPMAVDPEPNQRLIEEARLSSRVAHPNVAQLFDLGRDEGRMFLLREWVVGIGMRPLLARTWQARRSLPPAASLRIGLGVARALDYLHGLRAELWAPEGVAHRRVAPATILVSASGEVKLANLSRSALNPRFDSQARQVDEGFPAFAAPEVLEGGEATPESDIFGLGAVLYEALGGSDSMLGAPKSDWTRNRRVLDLHEEVAASDLPRRLRHVLASATLADPAQRPSALEFKRDLRRWMYDELDTDGEDELRQAVSNVGER